MGGAAEGAGYAPAVNEDRPTRTLLLLSTHFYPAPTVAAVRWTEFCRHLPEHGWRVVVLSRYYGVAAEEGDLAQTVSPHVEVRYLNRPMDDQPRGGPGEGSFGSGGQDAGAARGGLRERARRLVMEVGFVPDPSVVFWRRAHARLIEEARRARPDVIAATIPPWGKGPAAVRLAREVGAPLVMDRRDPLIIDERYGPYGAKRLRARAYERFDRLCHTAADLTVHAIPTEHRWARLRYPEARRRMRELTNGFPPDMLDGGVEPIGDAHGRRSVRVVGAMGGAEMLTLGRAVRALRDAGEDVSLTLVGKPPGSSGAIRGLLGDRVEIVGRVEHRRALGYVLGADVLVNFVSGSRRGSFLLSTKLFEYAAAGKPVVEVNPSRSDRFFVRRLPGVLVLRDPGEGELAGAIGRCLRGEGVPTEAARRRVIGEHAWPAKAARVAGWLDDLAAGGEVRP